MKCVVVEDSGSPPEAVTPLLLEDEDGSHVRRFRRICPRESPEIYDGAVTGSPVVSRPMRDLVLRPKVDDALKCKINVKWTLSSRR